MKDQLLNFINENTDLDIIKDERNYILCEAFFIPDDENPKEKRKLMIRSIKVDGVPHPGLRTAKLKSKDIDKISRHCKKEGLPVTFKPVIIKGEEVWEWDIALKTQKEKDNARKKMSDNDIKFLNKIIGTGGQDFADYWDTEEQNKIKEIEDKYK